MLVTEWAEFLESRLGERQRPSWRRPVVIDGRNALDADALVGLGFTYEGIGTLRRE